MNLGVPRRTIPPAAVAIGTSAGGLEALSTILPSLPPEFPLPILVVIHLSPHKDSLMAELLQAKCDLRVKEAEDKEPIVRGTVYFAPPDYHLLVEDDYRLSLSSEEAVNYSRPSVDVLFESAADAYGAGLIGVVLTGANQDGAAGLRKVQAEGGLALVQAPQSAYAPGMPEAALAACPSARVLPLGEIAGFLQEVACS
ncbi:MAG TPA: chemotaxis protein CheB [Pirellulales bacterium]|jgi:two-component system chemotaxis response regulator CheB|nr:chemotaxis protein CheB [Pirellulales bacterium]